MPMCRDCKFYTTIDGVKGNCYGYDYGHEVQGDRDSSVCSQNMFKSRYDKDERNLM